MNPVDHQLNRLLKSAASAPKPAPGAAVFTLEARVLGAWRAMRVDRDEFLVAWFRRAALCGALLALASLAWTYHGSMDRKGAELAVADSAMRMGVE